MVITARTLLLGFSFLAASLQADAASGAPRLSPVEHPAPSALASLPVETLAFGLGLLIPIALGVYLLRPRRPMTCPNCGARNCAAVGQVGMHRRGYRCHACGYHWTASERPEWLS